MPKIQIVQIFSELMQAFSEPRFTSRFSRSKKALHALLRKEGWPTKLAHLPYPGKRIDCREIYSLCETTLDQLGPRPEEGWPLFSYRYGVSLLFEDPDFTARRTPCEDGAVVFLTVLQVRFDAERKSNPFDPLLDFNWLTAEERAASDHRREYTLFMTSLREEYVYEIMRLGCAVTPYRTLEHIAGVHHIALTVARSFYSLGGDVDLALISAAAAGHDIGKFGCRPNERVPYLHYYYTGLWFHRRSIDAVGHIAANHSVWDLSLENSAWNRCF
jgi:hypothetical protein